MINPELGAVVREGEARAAALITCGTWGAIKRHRKAGEPLCGACLDHQRTYNRDYARIRRRNPTYAARKAAENRARHRHLYADPGRVAQINTARRRHRQAKLEADRLAVDPIAVERACALHWPLPPLNKAEKACAYKEMLRLCVPRHLIVERLRISWTTARSIHSQVVEIDLNTAGTSGQNDSEAEQRANATRPLTETPAYPGGRPMPSIAAHPPDSCQQVA